MGSFWAVRPMSTFNLALSRMKVGLVGIIMGFIILVIMSALAISIFDIKRHMSDASLRFLSQFDLISIMGMSVSIAMVFIALCWIAYSLTLSFNLWGNEKIRKKVSAVVSVLFVLIIIIISAIRIKITPEQILQIIMISPIFLIIPTVALISLIAWLSDHFKRLANLKKSAASIMTILAACSFILLNLWLSELPTPGKIFFSIILVNLAMLSFLPIMLSTIALKKNRHR
jgi:hypothetical protein